jgi:eukaryotic-like serine/threonine-protein kinase
VAGRLLADRYRTEQLLGGGGMASVWRGRDLRLDRPVAIKMLSDEGQRRPMALERFAREARAVSRLTHPNVVSVFDVGTEDGRPYLVMELVDGPTVATLLADGPLAVADVLAIGAQVCDGLAAAHAAGIIHRDIKPANLIVTRSGVVKICDFGVARLLDKAGYASLTAPATAWGSPSYMAPEQINAEPVDARTDLYGLGCTMYAMLTGAPPFTDGGPFSIMRQHLVQPPEPLRARRPEVPRQVEALVANLLAKQPDDRPADATLVRTRIAAAADFPAVGAAPHGLLLRSAAVTRAVAALTTPPDADPPREAPDAVPGRPARSRLPAIAATAALALSAVAVAIAAAPMLRSATGDAAIHSTASTAPAATSPAPVVAVPLTTGSPAARPSARPSSASAAPSDPTSTSPSPTDPIVALRQAIAQQVTAGGLKADAAADLNHNVDDLAHTIATGNTGAVATKITALRGKLTALNKGGKLSADGYRVLSSAVDQVAASQG